MGQSAVHAADTPQAVVCGVACRSRTRRHGYCCELMQAELSSRELLVLEADTVLAEAARRLAGLAALAAAAPALGSGSSSSTGARPPQRQSVAAASSSSRRLTPGAGGPPGATSSMLSISSGGGGSSAAGVVAVADRVVEQAHGVAAWCRTAASRISR